MWVCYIVCCFPSSLFLLFMLGYVLLGNRSVWYFTRCYAYVHISDASSRIFLGVSKCQTQKGKDVRIWATRKTIWPRLSQKMVKLARCELSNNVRFWAAAPVEAFHKMCCLWLLFQVKYTLKLHNFCNLRLSGSRRSNFQFSLSNGVSRRSN